MIFFCIPAYNEAGTIGLLLWRIRKVLQDSGREYEVLVYDDGSTDSTAETLEPYTKVLPLTVIGGREHRGYAEAVSSLLQAVSGRTKYPRRDAVVLMQGDFTDQPEHLIELIKRFEGGADLVVADQAAAAHAPPSVRRLRMVAPWLLKPFVAVPGIADPFSSFRLLRVSVVRDLLKQAGSTPLLSQPGWAANVELLVAAAPFARRIETVPLAPRYDLRPRPSRIRPFADARTLLSFGWATRGRRTGMSSP